MEKHTKIGNLNTAEEILKTKETYDEEYPTVSISDATEAMIEFAKLHCRAQLTAILSNVTIKHYNALGQHDPHVDYESIDKAYPLENIK